MTNNKTEYDIQADEFATLTGLTMTAIYLGHYPRLDPTHISSQWRVTLTVPGTTPYGFDFSQSINESFVHMVDDSRKIQKGVPPTLKTSSFMRAWPEVRNGGWWVRIRNYRVKEAKNSPSLYDVLACLQKYDPGCFEDFCADFGYDTDSRKAETIYRAVMKEWRNVDRLFHYNLEQLREIN